MNKPEILAPAGSLSKLKTAVLYGADAVYCGMKEFSLRTAASNFTFDELRQGVDFAHERGKKVYVATNIIPDNQEISVFENAVKAAVDAGADAQDVLFVVLRRNGICQQDGGHDKQYFFHNEWVWVCIRGKYRIIFSKNPPPEIFYGQ